MAQARFQLLMRGAIPGSRSWFVLDRQEQAEVGVGEDEKGNLVGFPNRDEAARYVADPENYAEVAAAS
jgi:hypothetical protein